MSIEAVRAYLAQYDKKTAVREFDVSSATVELAAAAVGVEGARICKTLAFQDKEGGCILVCAAGDGKISNRRFKDTFGLKAKLLSHEDTARMTGHAVGGVCPFALPDHVAVYCDESLKRFETVFPAAGTANSAVELTPEELFTISTPGAGSTSVTSPPRPKGKAVSKKRESRPCGAAFLRSDGNSKKSEVFPSLCQKARDAAPTPPEKSKKKPRPGRAGAGTE